MGPAIIVGSVASSQVVSLGAIMTVTCMGGGFTYSQLGPGVR